MNHNTVPELTKEVHYLAVGEWNMNGMEWNRMDWILSIGRDLQNHLTQPNPEVAGKTRTFLLLFDQ